MSALPKKFAVLRIKKLHNPEEISKVGTHNDRRGIIPANVDKSRIKENISFVANKRPLLDRVMAKLEGIKYRKDAVKAVEIICGFSEGCEKFIDVESWAKDSLGFLKKTFGEEKIVSAELHRDEKTPHLQVIIIPLIDGKLAAKRLFGTRKKLSDLQTAYHDVVKKYGLIRGTKGSNRPHLTMQEMYKGTQIGMEIIKKTLEELPDKPFLQSKEDYKKTLEEHFSTSLKPLINAKTLAEIAALDLQSLRRQLGEAEEAQKDVQNRLRSLDLKQVAERLLGYEGVKDGKSVVFEDDARRIVISGNAFKDEKCTARAERGAISLTRHILDIDFDTAVKILGQHFSDDSATVIAEAVRESEEIIKIQVERSAREKIDLEEKIKLFATADPAKLIVAVDYLEKIKGIPRKIITALVAESKVWANRWGAVCFLKESSDGIAKGVSILNISSDVTQSFGKENTIFHVGNFDFGKQVAVVESPLDALSYHVLTGASAVATDGHTTAKGVIIFLKALFTKNIVAANQGGKAGEIMAEEIISEAIKAGMIATRKLPPKGGWNHALQNPSTSSSTTMDEDDELLTPKMKLSSGIKESGQLTKTPSIPSVFSPQVPQQEASQHEIKNIRERRKVRIKKGPSKR